MVLRDWRSGLDLQLWRLDFEDGWVGQQTQFTISIDRLNCCREKATLHVLRRLELVGSLSVGGLDCHLLVLILWILDEDAIVPDWNASHDFRLLPSEIHESWIARLRLQVDRLRNGVADVLLRVQNTIFTDLWLIQKEGARIGERQAFFVDAVAALETESDPVLLPLVPVVEGQVHFIDCLSVPWSVNLYGCRDLSLVD